MSISQQGQEELLPYNILTNSQTRILNALIENTSNFVSHDVRIDDDTSLYINQVVNNFNEYQPPNDSCPGLIPSNQIYHTLPIALPQDEANHGALNSNPFKTLDDIPAMDVWSGHLNFGVEFSKAQDRTKATPWIVCILI